MTPSVYIRPLSLEDALISYQWRNDPKIWTLTGSRPNQHITAEMETEWLRNVLMRKNEKRFAICIAPNQKYVGNIHLSNIIETTAQYSGLFIGERELWGKGIGTTASKLLVEYAFTDLNIQSLYGFVRKENDASLAMLKKLGFQPVELSGDFVKVFLSKSFYREAHPQS